MRKVTFALAGLVVVAAALVATSAMGSNGDPHAVKAYAGYADNVHTVPGFLPSPWAGDPGVTFRGSATPWDAGAIRLDNPSKNPLTVADVSVTIGATVYDLWGPYPIVVPGKSTLILTQTVQFDFDTSEDPSQGTCAAPSSVIPVIHVTVGARKPKTKTFKDVHQVLNTGGRDPILCPGITNEGIQWHRVTAGKHS
jgi:hypothetical protein